ncbi:MAG: cation:proton antiporter [Prevotella sp.]|nr:cation:proton antiporter [Prevotella sp.]
MSQLEPLIADLALILICAGVMTLLFKKLKQPIVLGYIVAGFLASPNMPYMPSITDGHGVHVCSEIGVIFLLFALGLEFSFKKILKMGAAPIVAAIAIILSMMYVGSLTGSLFGWSEMDCIYLGGMLAMSSTTIIFKAFDDMGLRQQPFASLVLSVLIIEDILAIVLMVMLSTLAVSSEFEGTQMLGSILQLGFFLILWFTVGIYLIPLFLKKAKSLMNEETLLITALATLTICAPFLWSLMRQGSNSAAANRLWYDGGRGMRIKITALAILRLAIGAAFIAYIIGNTLPKIGMYGIFAVIAIACCIFMSRNLQKQSDLMTKTFTDNLKIKE